MPAAIARSLLCVTACGVQVAQLVIHCYLCGACSCAVVFDLPHFQTTDCNGRPVTAHSYVVQDALDHQLALAMYAQAKADRAALCMTPEALGSAGPYLGHEALRSLMQLAQQQLVAGVGSGSAKVHAKTLAAMRKVSCRQCVNAGCVP